MSDFFLHGAQYERTTGIPRAKCCETCAFRPGDGTVRPHGVSIDQVAAETSFCDDFICHQPDENGSHPSCAGWFARFSCAALREQKDASHE